MLTSVVGKNHLSKTGHGFFLQVCWNQFLDFHFCKIGEPVVISRLTQTVLQVGFLLCVQRQPEV